MLFNLMAEVTESDIRERFAEVDELMARHEAALAYLKQEREELATAIRVFERFGNRPDIGSDILPAKPLQEDIKKPAGIPPMPNMILNVLGGAMLVDGSWMEPKTIADQIRNQWWPEAPQTSVGPIAWRMWKEGRLKKEGSLYTVPENETPARARAGVLEPQAPISHGDLF